jgi:sugar lactone lactonase YvrE
MSILATGQAMPRGIATDGSHVYWVTWYGGTVARVPVAGGAVETLVTGRQFPIQVAVDGGFAIWTEDGTQTDPTSSLLRVPVAGGSPASLGAGFLGPDWLLIHAGTAYVADRGGTLIETVQLASGTRQTFAAMQSSPFGLATDGTALYWTTGDGAIRTRPLAGGATTTIATGLGIGDRRAQGLAVVGGTVYATGDRVIAVPAQGGAITTVDAGAASSHLLDDGTAVYWATRDACQHELLLRARPGEAATVLGSFPSAIPGTFDIEGFAADATRLYVANGLSGTILAIDKPQ